MSEFLSADFFDWIAGQGGWEGATHPKIVQDVTFEVVPVARRLVEEVTGLRLPVGDAALLPYARRVWRCVECHWRKFAKDRPIQLADVISRLESGQLAFESSQSSNVLREVVMAQGMELREQKAAVMFETEYMPTVGAIALRVGGAHAAEDFRNFAADLILTSDNRAPKIASYLGRLPLCSWLRPVIRNAWISQKRIKTKEVSSEPFAEASVPEDAVDRIDASPCSELLQPIFAQAVTTLKTEDRVILKMLILDKVPQKELARSLGIHSGNVTRRRDNAAAHVFSEVRRLSLAGSKPRQAADCLDLLLAWNQPELTQRLAEILTSEIRAVPTEQQALSELHGREEPS